MRGDEAWKGACRPPPRRLRVRATVFTFGGGLLGITYGALSSSWDPNREGSALGWNEMQANLSILLSSKDKQ
ncbi:Protein PAM68, chloroplastic [Tetrabaena socialis]|uniref:Protein PAM68, chloroplastic n=1 Tax=Tetrabaena socialis TaxID=47790 RepID=A0A2J8A5G5_9CHLO|nr:Protein PAM68, chloroplastic [Tetrabaena socialis]|eukprot:PNH07750.1 Protein PAM68, chloroplastic [Tetrabaena socialis]